MTITSTLKTLTTLGVLVKFTYRRLVLKVSSGVSDWVRLLRCFKNDPML